VVQAPVLVQALLARALAQVLLLVQVLLPALALLQVPLLRVQPPPRVLPLLPLAVWVQSLSWVQVQRSQLSVQPSRTTRTKTTTTSARPPQPRQPAPLVRPTKVGQLDQTKKNGATAPFFVSR
jgi:hypothetical protein